MQVRRHSVSLKDDLMPAHLARPDSIDLPGLGLTVVTSLGIRGRLYTAQYKFENCFADLVASDFSFGRTLAAASAPLDCCGLKCVSPD